MAFSQIPMWRQIKRRLANGLLLLAGSTMLLAWAALLLVAVLTYLSLTIPIQSRT